MRKTDHNKTILWTELNAFDPQSPDCGAAEYIKLLGFTPQAVSLFVFGSDFVHQHDGMAEALLLADYCKRTSRKPTQ